jgi:hypothetical protein
MRGKVPGLLAIALVFGCGTGDELGRRYPVRGTVTYKGQPLETGRITFTPIANDGSARVATGTIRQGSYTLSTAGGDDGALPGKYGVPIVSQTADHTKIQGITGGGAGRQSDVLNATRKARNLIPRKYMSSQASGLVQEVKAETNEIDFGLVD